MSHLTAFTVCNNPRPHLLKLQVIKKKEKIFSEAERQQHICPVTLGVQRLVDRNQKFKWSPTNVVGIFVVYFELTYFFGLWVFLLPHVAVLCSLAYI